MELRLPDPVMRTYVRKLFPLFEAPFYVGRAAHGAFEKVRERRRRRPTSSPALPDAYRPHNEHTRDGELELDVIGTLPEQLRGSLYVCQSLGMPTNFQCGDVNIVRIDFAGSCARIRNRRFDPPAVIAREGLCDTPYEMPFFGYMHWGFCVGAQAYAEGMWLMPDGQIAVTSDIERPYLIDPESLAVTSAFGRREQWLSFAPEPMASLIGKLFPLTNNSQGLFHDHETGEVFTADFRMRLADPEHPVRLLRYTQAGGFETYPLATQTGAPLEITQNLHEIVGTREHVVLVDTGFATGNDVFFPWLPLPRPKPTTHIHVVRRRDLIPGRASVPVTSFEVDLPAIHLFAEYDCPDERITLYLLHTPFTNVADLIRPDDVDLDGKPFPAHVVGYGTLPPLDVSALGKHVLDMRAGEVVSSQTLRDERRTFAPYMFTLPRRQTEHFGGSHAYVMFRGFSRDLLPKRVLESFVDEPGRVMPLGALTSSLAERVLPSICRVDCRTFELAGCYVFPEKTLCFTLCTLDADEELVIAGVVTDDRASARSSGHEYWIFRGAALEEGPIAKLVHPELFNHTLFHAVFVPGGAASLAARAERGRYHLPIREDYPEQELALYPDKVQDIFRERIYRRYERR